MMMTIYGGNVAEISVGTMIKLVPGYLPSYFDDKILVVTKIQSTEGISYPYALFYSPKDNLNQESAISPEIIKEVV